MKYFLGIDLGTSGCRSAVFDEDLRMLSQAAVDIPIYKISSDEVEQEAEDWWQGLVETTRKALQIAAIPAHEIQALSISSQSISVVPVGTDGNPLSRALSWLDSRAEKQRELLEQRYSFETLYAITGKRSSAIYTLPKVCWLAQERPEIFHRAHKFLLPMDFLIYRLCGAYSTDHTCAGGTMYYDIRTCRWFDSALNQCGIPSAKLPDLQWSGTPVGTLSPEAASVLGLRPETIVAMGGQDQKCASLGAGLDADSTTVSLGTAGCVEYLSTEPVGDPQCRIPLFAYLFPNTWVLEGILSTCGICYSWFREILGTDVSFREMDRFASEAPPLEQPVFFYPYLSGSSSPNWTETTGYFARLSLATTKGHLLKSIMEGIAYSIRANLTSMERFLAPRKTLKLFGGCAKSPLFSQIIANITGKEVVVCPQAEMALIGAAKLAMQGAGVAIPSTASDSLRYRPEPDAVEKYNRNYAEYEALRRHLFDIM